MELTYLFPLLAGDRFRRITRFLTDQIMEQQFSEMFRINTNAIKTIYEILSLSGWYNKVTRLVQTEYST